MRAVRTTCRKGGETHFGRRDVALLDTLDGWTVHVPGHPDETEALVRAETPGAGRVYVRLADQSNAAPLPVVASGLRGRSALHVVRRGSGGSQAVVVAVGPMLDRTLAATQGRDVTILYAATVRPFDTRPCWAAPGSGTVVLVEPYLAGTSTGVVAQRSGTGRTASSAWASVGPSWATTGRPPTTTAPTVSTQRGCGARSTRSSAEAGQDQTASTIFSPPSFSALATSSTSPLSMAFLTFLVAFSTAWSTRSR